MTSSVLQQDFHEYIYTNWSCLYFDFTEKKFLLRCLCWTHNDLYRCEVEDLEPDEQYEFRVSAVNEMGQSEPLLTTRPITAKYPFGEQSVI